MALTYEDKRWIMALLAASRTSLWASCLDDMEEHFNRLEKLMSVWQKYEQKRLAAMFCDFEDCDQTPVANGMCYDHLPTLIVGTTCPLGGEHASCSVCQCGNRIVVYDIDGQEVSV